MSEKIMLVLVLDKIQLLNDLLLALSDKGIKSATVINSAGMMQQLANSSDQNIISTLRPLFIPNHSENKTMFMILTEEEVKVARQVIREVIGDLSQPETGILFAIPTLFTDGIRDLSDEETNV